MSGKKKREPYTLPEEDRERMTRDEMNALIYFKCALASAGYAWQKMQRKLGYVPAGLQRFKMFMGGMNSLIEDIGGTMPKQSQKRMDGIVNDFKIALIPQAATEPKRLVMDSLDGATLMEAAMHYCEHECVMTDEEAKRNCKLYKIFETYMPLNHYGDGGMCEYGKKDFE